MKDSEIEMYLEQIDRDSSTVGIQIPEDMEVDGETIPLEHIVYNICSEGEVPDQFDLNVNEIKVNLRRKRNDMIDKIENDEVSSNKAELIVNKTKQIDRALNAIDSPSDEDLESKIKRKEAQDEKKWRNFIKKIKGEDNSRGRR